MQMKIWYFLQWQWRQFDTWQRFWLLGMFLIGAGVGADQPRGTYFMLTGFAIIAGFVLKWIIWDGISNAWARYNEEQNQIVDILSDKK